MELIPETYTKHREHLFSEKFHFLSHSGTLIPADFLLGKVICLLYGAAWSPPFIEFLETFKSFYAELVKDEAPLEVIYVSFDRTTEEMTELMSGLPVRWVGIPHGNSMINYLKLKYSIVVIPKLVVVRDSGVLITDKGVKDVKRKTKRCFTDWYNVANNNPVLTRSNANGL